MWGWALCPSFPKAVSLWQREWGRSLQASEHVLCQGYGLGQLLLLLSPQDGMPSHSSSRAEVVVRRHEAGEAALFGPLPESSCPSVSCCRRSLAPIARPSFLSRGPGHELLFHSPAATPSRGSAALEDPGVLDGAPKPEPESESKARTEAWRGWGQEQAKIRVEG